MHTKAASGQLEMPQLELKCRWQSGQAVELRPFSIQGSPLAAFDLKLGMARSNPLGPISIRSSTKIRSHLLKIAIGRINARSMKRN
jgi:hypothetical protein